MTMSGGKRVVITGGAGFIGSNLAAQLVKDNEVIILDNLSTGKMENIEGLIATKKASFVQGSILDLPLLTNLFQGISHVFHQAALPSVPRSIAHPLECHEANATGTLNVLLAARDSGVRKVVFASSSSVYGDVPTLPKQEEMTPRPQSPYAASKLMAEYYCSVFSRVYGLPSACLRYFNVYGPGQNADSQYAAVVPKFIGSILKGEQATIFGDGEQTRDFTFVSDVVQANILAAADGAEGVFNVSAGERSTLNDLATTIAELMGKTLEPMHREPRAGDIRHSLADISRARGIGYQPEYNLRSGLKETINFFESRGNAFPKE